MMLVPRLMCACLIAFAATSATVASADSFGTGPQQFDIEFVTIGNPGNVDDSTGVPNPAGSVNYVYRMGKFEISENMIANANVLGSLGITKDSRGPDKPATSTTWLEAVNFVNWLNTDAGSPPAYNLDASGLFQVWQPSDAGYNAANLYRNSNARYFLPSIDEWYKAAYYDPTNGVYFDYPTGSNNPPVAVASGTVTGTAVYDGQTGPADIFLAGGASPYGTIAQAGNVVEWQETDFDLVNGPDPYTSNRGVRGGYWGGVSNIMLGLGDLPLNHVDPVLGFRVASLANVVPEPTGVVLLASSITGFGLIARFRRRQVIRTSRVGGISLSLLGLLVLAPHVDAAIIGGPITNPANGSRYYLLEESGWTAAQTEAVTLGGNLATINDSAEQQWVYSTFATLGNVNRNLWIGLYDPDPATNAAQRAQRRLEFEWVSGELSSYRNWSPVEPNNPQTNDPENPELFGHIWNPADSNAGEWNNFRDLATVFGRPVNGVVEVMAVPEPSAMGLLFLGAFGLRYLPGRIRCIVRTGD